MEGEIRYSYFSFLCEFDQWSNIGEKFSCFRKFGEVMGHISIQEYYTNIVPTIYHSELLLYFNCRG